MKRKSLFLIILLISFSYCFAQSEKTEAYQDSKVPFRLFETRNNWNYIMLDTITGKMWMIQYDIQGNNRGGTILSDVNLAKDKEEIVGRFTLYPTANTWTFILLDQYEGATWQVQWSFEKENRFVIPIYQAAL